MGPFEAFYGSPLQHPGFLWGAALLALAVVIARRGIEASLRRYLLSLVVLSLLDAWLSSHHVYGIGTLSGAAASVVPLFFVLAGDFRYLLLAVGASANGALKPSVEKLALALGLTVVVPLSTQLLLALLPERFDTPRVMFLIYEVSFVLLTLSLLRLNANVQRAPWLGRVSRFVIVYYSLWALSDAIILFTGSDLGFGLRVVPNVLYYGGLIAAIARFAPDAGER